MWICQYGYVNTDACISKCMWICLCACECPNATVLFIMAMDLAIWRWIYVNLNVDISVLIWISLHRCGYRVSLIHPIVALVARHLNISNQTWICLYVSGYVYVDADIV
jgi:hypothetical protein